MDYKLILSLALLLLSSYLKQADIHAQCLGMTSPESNVYFPFTNGISDSASLLPNYSGTFNGSVTSDGLVGNCLTFNGLSDYVLLNSNLNLDDDYTLATWIYPESSHYGTIFSQRAQCSSSDRGWGKLFLGIGGDLSEAAPFPFFTAGLATGSMTVSNQIFVSLPRCAFNCNGFYNAEIYTVPGVQVQTGCWSFIAITATNNSSTSRQLKAFINGEMHDMILVNSPPSTSSATQPFGNVNASYESLFGINHYNVPSNAKFPFDGRIDEFYFYEYALDKCQLKSIASKIVEIARLDPCNTDSLHFSAISNANLTLEIWLQNGSIASIGNSLNLSSNVVSQNDTISFVYQAENQCDIDTIHALATYTGGSSIQFDTINICSSDSILIFGNWVNSSGSYSDTFSLNGCDSIQNIELIVNDTLFSMTQLVSCDSVIFQGQSFFNDTLISSSYTSLSGCDSIFQTQIRIKDTVDVTNLELSSCDSVTIDGFTLYSDTIFNVLYSSLVNNCDSQVIYNLKISRSVKHFDTVSSCYTYIDLLGVTHTKSDTVTYFFQSAEGCDSVVNLLIEIKDSTEIECELKNCQLVFPNAITPNADGINDIFEDMNNCTISNGSMFIYNRWGTEVFRSAKNNFGWDGNVNDKKASQGVYFYIFVINETVLKGSFTLL